MAKINENFLRLKGSYLFSEIAKRVSTFQSNNPEIQLIRLGIGDVTRPISDAVTQEMLEAVKEMSNADTFRGYGPESGYAFLREAILQNDYVSRGINFDIDEIFISDGAKTDTGSIGDIFDVDNIVAIGDPVYPVYLDTNVMSGRSGNLNSDGYYENIVYMPCTEENGFLPQIPSQRVDLIYLCFPNNPTGVTATAEYLKKWVDYANENDSVILYDSAYEAYIQDKDVPRSIFEIEGAKECAIEFRSFSKTAGFTGTRCAYTVISKNLVRGGVSLNTLWNRRQSTKFNGVPYVVQKGAFATYSDAGKKQVAESVNYYMQNAKAIKQSFTEAGLTVFGGDNAPYVWIKTPNGASSWEFFDLLLNKANVVSTPGVGFGSCGEGYIRLSAFGEAEKTKVALKRILDTIKI